MDQTGVRPPDNALPTDIIRVAAVLVTAAVVIAGLYYGRAILIPLAFAFLISFALSPLITWLSWLGVPRVLSVIAVMGVVVISLAGLGLLLGTQVRALSEQLPAYRTTMHNKLTDVRQQLRAPGMIDGAIEAITAVRREVEDIAPRQPDAPQRVSVVPPPASPIDTIIALLTPTLEPLATAGLVFIFVFIVLYDRGDLRDRLLRLLGGNLHRSTDALEEAGTRISRYLLMQLLVNVTYGVPMALGLWLIGVPGALLWGTVAAVLRFIPYLGPVIAAVFPLALAFAVDPGWSMVLWTIALIVGLELISNNVVEPLLYGSSTGLSAMALIVAATFWTALWGPVGLILSTPLTVCLLVIGRKLPQLQVFETILGSAPALDPPTRLYQRLIADDAMEALDLAEDAIREDSVETFYNDVGIPVLQLASEDYLRHATAEHRLRVTSGLEDLLEELRADHPPAADLGPPRIVCIGGKWDVDGVSAAMLSHALELKGFAATTRSVAAITSKFIDRLDLDEAEVVCLTYFTAAPEPHARHFCRRLQNRWPHLKIVLALWRAPEELLEDDRHEKIGATEVVTSIHEAVERLHRMLAPREAEARDRAAEPANEAPRIAALKATGILDGHAREDLDAIAKRAADAFNVGFAVISAIDSRTEFIVGQSKHLPGTTTDDDANMIVMPRSEAICDHVVSGGKTLVVPDAERDPRFSDHPAINLWHTRFYAGAPLRTRKGLVLGALCLLDTEPRTLQPEEIELLETMAEDVTALITDGAHKPAPGPSRSEAEDESALVGQRVPE